jgi:hypothetical protein
VTMGSREGPSAMKHRMGSAAVSSWKRLKVVGKMRRQEREAMAWDVLSSAGFIGIANDSVTIRFSRKNGPFRFNNPRNPDAESRSQNVWSLKDFEIRSIPEKELSHNGQKVINPFDTIISRNKNEVLA